MTDLSTFKVEPDLFHEFVYRDTLKAMIEAVMDAESALLADMLAQRIARAWLDEAIAHARLHMAGQDRSS